MKLLLLSIFLAATALVAGPISPAQIELPAAEIRLKAPAAGTKPSGVELALPTPEQEAREAVRSTGLYVSPEKAGVKPIYENSFESAAVDKTPEGTMAIAGDFQVKEEAGNKFLELPGEPLDTFGLLFGPAGSGGQAVSGRVFGTKKGRKFPAFGVSLGGVGGYRLIVSAGKKMLEIFKGDEVRASVAFDWAGDAWTALRLQLRKGADGGSIIEGKAWPAGKPEPAEWQVRLEEKDAPPQGRAGLWGSPYSGTPIRFDDLSIAPATE